MKVTFVTPTLNYTGGLRVIAIYADWLSRFGHHVTVVSPGKPRPNFKKRIKYFLKGKKWDSERYFSTVYFEPLNIDLIILDSCRPVEERDLPDADIVIATWWETSHWVNKLSVKKGKKVYFMQDYGYAPGQPMDKIQETWMLPFHIITIAEWLVDMIKKHRGKDDGVTLVSNGVDISKFTSPPRNKNVIPTIGFLYTVAPQKGIELMVDAFLTAKESIADLRLIMFGSNDIPDKLRDMPSVEYYQQLADTELPKVYSSCDAWLFGSSREGFGLPILEAMACRTPVIATTAGAAAQLVNPSTGVLLGTSNVDEMANAIVDIVSMNNESWKALSEGAYDMAQKHTWDQAAETFEKTLQELLG
jgi:glycosyltransferase involved in cell wall biosynthesis